ncbi:MAG TPA: metalloregulator ArsR/SmtB family transcription factor [Bacteroidales bacterium]|nr:metalloregulator ArsR/SmtB family transcription factor [Bacteroidales bacterium]
MSTDVFHAIADPTRRSILVLIAEQAMTPGSIAGNFDASRQAVSKHIKILLKSNLLKQEKIGREILYHLNPDKMTEVNVWLDQLKVKWEQRFSQLDIVLTNLNANQNENKHYDHEFLGRKGKQKNKGGKGI